MATHKQRFGDLHSIKEKLSIDALLNPQHDDGKIISFIPSPNISKSPRIPPAIEYLSDSISSHQGVFLSSKRPQPTISCSVVPYVSRDRIALPPYHHHTFPTLGPPSLQLNPNQPQENEKSSSQYLSTSHGNKRLGSDSKYEEEHMYFLWYHYVDLHQDWAEILAVFHRQFPDIHRLKVEVIRQKLRRFVKGKGAPSPRIQRSLQQLENTEKPLNTIHSSQESHIRDAGVLQLGNVWYSWMEKDTSFVFGNRVMQPQNGLGD
jgi:hypothetical protein